MQVIFFDIEISNQLLYHCKLYLFYNTTDYNWFLLEYLPISIKLAIGTPLRYVFLCGLVYCLILNIKIQQFIDQYCTGNFQLMQYNNNLFSYFKFSRESLFSFQLGESKNLVSLSLLFIRWKYCQKGQCQPSTNHR